ncbi:carboxylate methylbutanoyltransferase [Cladobotryum mycophilum]|uniref:Carboxylate methylbutanoyltransferase n=1 Tax=Cladobotryum mycophilum TaxID=491253 RepID=A0ABR0SAS9_9HYPO
MEKLSAIIENNVARGQDTKDKLLGAAFVVTNRDGIIYSGSAGRIGFDVDSPKFDGGSFAWVASLTKLLTAPCLLQLVEQGKIGLDDDLRQLVPELGQMRILRGFTPEDEPILENNDRPITLRLLLTHTVGLSYDVADPDLQKWSKAINRTASMVGWTKAGYDTPFKFTPGDGWVYGSAFDWGGILLEKLTGQTIGDYMKQHVLDPLGMHDTGFHPNRLPQVANRTIEIGIRDDDKGTVSFFDPVPPHPEMESGGAGLFTTANDYARVLRAMLQDEPGVVSGETLKHMFSPQLNETQRAMLESTCYDPLIHPAFVPGFPDGLKLNHGWGGVLNMEDIPGQRRKGSMTWSGAGNPRWWIDRESGIAGVLILGLFPHGDAAASNMFVELERAVYELLVK